MKAILSDVRISPRKIKLAADLIRRQNVNKAENILHFTVKKSARILIKVLRSAIANAIYKGEVKNNLKVKDIFIGPGKYLKRFRPKNRGSALPILKRTSNISIFLEKIEEIMDVNKGGNNG